MNKAVALEALGIANEVLGASGVRFWLDCGSLLGAVRDDGIMDHDLDVDFSSWDWQRHEEIAEAMVTAGFTLIRTHGTPESGFEQRFGWASVKLDVFYFYEGTVDGPEEGTCWQGSWDHDRLIESRFPTDIVRETVPFTFAGGITVPVPIEFEALLTARYGDWTVSVPKWDWRTDPKCIVRPKRLEDVTFLLKSFMRPDTTLRAVRSIRATYEDAQVLVVDDSDISKDFAVALEEEGGRLLRLPFDSGLSAGRNAGIKEITTRYVVIMDDDMIVSAATRVPDMIELLDHGDIVCGSMTQAGRIINWEGTYELTDDGGLHLVQREGAFFESSGTRWAPVDFGLNCFVSTTDFIRSHPWDEALKLHEHTDFFLRLRGEGRVVFTPDCTFEHQPDRNHAYRKMRYRKEFRLRFFHKLGLRYHVGVSGHRDQWTSRDQVALERLLNGGQQRDRRRRQGGSSMDEKFFTVKDRVYLDSKGRATRGTDRVSLFAIPGQRIPIDDARAVGLVTDPAPKKAKAKPQMDDQTPPSTTGRVIPPESVRTTRKTPRKKATSTRKRSG